MGHAPPSVDSERVSLITTRAESADRADPQPGARRMLAVASFTPVARWVVRGLWAAGTAGLAVFAIAAAGGPGDAASTGYKVLFIAVVAVPAALCLVRALLVARSRATWALLGAGILSWGGGETVYLFFYDGGAIAPYPSAGDGLWLVYYCLSVAAVLALMRSGLSCVRRSVWVDALVGGLALAALGAALVAPVLADTGASAGAVWVNLAYPLVDVMILGLLIGVFAMCNGRPGRVWAVLALVWSLQAVVDALYLHGAAAGTYGFGTLLDATWPAMMLLIALAAWHEPTVTVSDGDRRWSRLVLTIGFAVVGVTLTMYDHWHRLSDQAVILATLTLVVAFVRTTLTFADMRALAGSAVLAKQNKLILGAAGEGIIGIDARGAVTFVNPAVTQMTGYAADELIGRTLHDALHHSKPDGTPYPIEECPIHASQLDGTLLQCDRDVYWRKDGTRFVVEYTGTPIVEGGRMRGAVVVLRDISERREIERVKDEFTSVVSHELRTPLTSIRGSLGLLESGVVGPLSDRAQRMVQIAVQNTDRLVRLINDILDLERLDSEALHLRESQCDAAQLIARATDAVLPAAVAADVTLAVDAAPGTLAADEDRLIQTLTNLISNAVKFSPVGGTVLISSERRSDDVLFSVRDEGPGIPADKLESIFGRFQQIDSSDSRQTGGTGLGLAISRSIVEHHLGRIWAFSGPDGGSTFSFVIPAAPDTAATYTPRAGGERGSVLMCDDNDEFLEVTGTMLEEHGFGVTLARSGEEAVQRALDERPDVLLLDQQLPGMSGMETVAALREHADTADIPVIVLSVLPGCDAETTHIAVDDWIQKPATPARLLVALDQAIRPRDDTFRVLFVERDRAVAKILSGLFGRCGVASFGATSGREAVALCERIRPDLIVLDDDLPDAEGAGIQNWLGRHGRTSALSVVGYEAAAVQDAERERRCVGAVTQILSKGQLTPEEFQWRVMTLLARPRTQRDTQEAGHAAEAHSPRR